VTERKKEMKKCIISLITGLSITSACANFIGSDDFNDDSMDVNKWNPSGSRIIQQNERLEFVHDTTDGVNENWGWIPNRGSYTQDWEIKLDVTSILDPSGWTTDKYVEFGIQVVNSGNWGDSFELFFKVDRFEGESYRFLDAEAIVHDKDDDVYATFDMGTYTNVNLSISFDAATKNLSARYDIGNGSVALLAFDIDSGGWDMSADDDFFAFIAAKSSGRAVASGEMYGDNFYAIPEPSTVLLFATGLFLMRYLRRKNG